MDPHAAVQQRRDKAPSVRQSSKDYRVSNLEDQKNEKNKSPFCTRTGMKGHHINFCAVRQERKAKIANATLNLCFGHCTFG